MRAKLGERFPALLALAIPVSAGLIYLAAFSAPGNYLLTNAAALLVALGWIIFGRAPQSLAGRRILTIILLVLLFIPLLTGPATNDVARWIPLGAFMLNSGAFAVPALAVLAAQDEDYAPPILLAALYAGSLQPDAALGFAVVFAAVGLHDVTRNWRIGLVAIIGFIASIAMALQGELPPQDFVERIFADLIQPWPFVALGLLAALAGSFALTLFATHLERASRFALAGSLFGFGLMALLSHYPTILIGYGVAPILGYGLALGLHRGPPRRNNGIPNADE